MRYGLTLQYYRPWSRSALLGPAGRDGAVRAGRPPARIVQRRRPWHNLLTRKPHASLALPPTTSITIARLLHNLSNLSNLDALLQYII